MSESAHETKTSDDQESEETVAGDEGSGYDSSEKEPGSDRGRGASDEEMVQQVESEGFDIDRVDIDDRDHTEDDEDDIEEERKRRLDPENRPVNAEVDNTQRTFDTEKGVFEDSPEEARVDGDPSFASEAESEGDDEDGEQDGEQGSDTHDEDDSRPKDD